MPTKTNRRTGLPHANMGADSSAVTLGDMKRISRLSVKLSLDVNALVAAFCTVNPHHASFNSWAAKQEPADIATCAITELGFIRVSSTGFGSPSGESRKLPLAFRASGVGYVGRLSSPAEHRPA